MARWLFSMLVAMGAAAHADTVSLGDRAIAGRLLALDRNGVTFQAGCVGDQTLRLSWKVVQGVQLNADCKGATLPVAPPPVPVCATAPLGAMQVRFRHSPTPLNAEDVVIASEGVVYLSVYEPWEWAHGPAKEVASVAPAWICRETPLPPLDLPAAFCREPRKLAVAFDYGTPLSNRIWTNGFSFVLRIRGVAPSGFDPQVAGRKVRDAFGHALGLWTSALSDRSALLTDGIRAFLKSRTAVTASGYRVETPPQVIELQCPQAATFVVELNFGGDGMFPDFPAVLAKGRIEGRTIALNMRAVPCFEPTFRMDSQNQLPFELPGGCVNMIPVLTHELGHAFGLKHIDPAQGRALMNPSFSRSALVPNDLDARALVEALNRSITGARAGVLEFESSDGVMPPPDWRR